MSFFDRDKDKDKPEQPRHANAPAGGQGMQRVYQVDNTQRVFDASVADFADTERARRMYAERGDKGAKA